MIYLFTHDLTAHEIINAGRACRAVQMDDSQTEHIVFFGFASVEAKMPVGTFLRKYGAARNAVQRTGQVWPEESHTVISAIADPADPPRAVNGPA